MNNSEHLQTLFPFIPFLPFENAEGNYGIMAVADCEGNSNGRNSAWINLGENHCLWWEIDPLWNTAHGLKRDAPRYRCNDNGVNSTITFEEAEVFFNTWRMKFGVSKLFNK